MNESAPISKKPIFQTFSEVKKALAGLKLPIGEEQRSQFIQGIAESTQRRQIAFRLLAPFATNSAGKTEKVVAFLYADLLRILADGELALEDLTKIPSHDGVMDWVSRQFPYVTTREEGEKYLETEHHLWTLYQILRSWTDTPRFIVALTAYAERLESLTVAGSGGLKRRQAKRASRFSAVVDTLIKKIPTRASAIQPLLENLRLCRAWATTFQELQEQLDAAQQRNERLKKQLENEQVALAEKTATLAASEERERKVAAQLIFANEKITSLEGSLKMQAGVHVATKSEAVADTIAEVRRKCLPALENIKLYADRAEPNTSAIIRKVEELTNFFTDLGV